MNVRQTRETLLCICVVLLLPSVAIATHYLPQHPTHTAAAPFTVQEFLHKGNHPFYLREPIEASLTKDDLPYLYDVLSSANCRDQWHKALLAVCVLDDGPRALETVVSKVTQPWDWVVDDHKGSQSTFALDYRIRFLWSVSMIDPALSVPFLAPLLSPEGATAFLESWGALPLPTNVPHDSDTLVRSVQRAAAYALIYTRSLTALIPITNELNRQAGITDSRGYWVNIRTVFMMAEVLGIYDFLEERGWEAGMHALRERQSIVGLGIIEPYVKKRFEVVETITNAGPHMFWKRVVVRHYRSWLGLGALTIAGILGILVYWRVRPLSKRNVQSEI